MYQMGQHFVEEKFCSCSGSLFLLFSCSLYLSIFPLSLFPAITWGNILWRKNSVVALDLSLFFSPFLLLSLSVHLSSLSFSISAPALDGEQFATEATYCHSCGYLSDNHPYNHKNSPQSDNHPYNHNNTNILYIQSFKLQNTFLSSIVLNDHRYPLTTHSWKT